MIQARHLRQGGAVLIHLGLCALVSSCVGYRPASSAFKRRPMLALSSITAPVIGKGERELARLDETSPAQLRRAWIFIRTKRPKQAIHLLNRILFSPPRPSPGARALGYYLRGQAFLARGDKTRAIEDCEQARKLALRTELRRRCDSDLARLRPRARVAKTTPKKTGSAAPPALVKRRNWNAARPIGDKLDRMRGIHRLTIHHSAVLSRNTGKKSVAWQIRGIQGFHMGPENRWGDIGYHFLIDPLGRIWKGRDLRYQGAHAGGVNNEHNVGICLLGRFVSGRNGQYPTSVQVQSMERLVRWLRQQYAIPMHGLLTHKELRPGTICPGSRLQAVVDRMRRTVFQQTVAQQTVAPTRARRGRRWNPLTHRRHPGSTAGDATAETVSTGAVASR